MRYTTLLLIVLIILLAILSSKAQGQSNECFTQSLKKLHFKQRVDTAAWTSTYVIQGYWSTEKFIKMVRHYVPEKEFNCIVNGYRNTKLYKTEFVLVLKNSDTNKVKIQAFNFDTWRALIYQ